jgi:uncharacterized protein YchJ
VQGVKGRLSARYEVAAAYYLDDQAHQLQERSRFKRYKGAWKYLDANG